MPYFTTPPKERVNIRYKSNVNQQQESIELPLKLLIIADAMQAKDSRPIEKRIPITIDKDNFDDALKDSKLQLNFQVPNFINDQGDQLCINLQPKSIHDFSPDNLTSQIPELKKLMQLRQALLSLKGPLGNLPSFRQQLETIITEPKSLVQLQKELANNDN